MTDQTSNSADVALEKHGGEDGEIGASKEMGEYLGIRVGAGVRVQRVGSMKTPTSISRCTGKVIVYQRKEATCRATKSFGAQPRDARFEDGDCGGSYNWVELLGRAYRFLARRWTQSRGQVPEMGGPVEHTVRIWARPDYLGRCWLWTEITSGTWGIKIYNPAITPARILPSMVKVNKNWLAIGPKLALHGLGSPDQLRRKGNIVQDQELTLEEDA